MQQHFDVLNALVLLTFFNLYITLTTVFLITFVIYTYELYLQQWFRYQCSDTAQLLSRLCGPVELCCLNTQYLVAKLCHPHMRRLVDAVSHSTNIFFNRKPNAMEIPFTYNSVISDYIANNSAQLCKFCSDHLIMIRKWIKWNFHHIWSLMKNHLVKWTSRHESANLFTELILGLLSANKRQRYFVATFPIGWAGRKPRIRPVSTSLRWQRIVSLQ